MSTESEEGTRVHELAVVALKCRSVGKSMPIHSRPSALAQSALLATAEQMLEQERFLAELVKSGKITIIDEMWPLTPRQRETIRRLQPVKIVEHDPRPTKGKYEPPHQFNSRLRAWLRRNP
jgi:hypothetical protein